MSQAISVKLDDEAREWLIHEARAQGQTISEYVRDALARHQESVEEWRAAEAKVEGPPLSDKDKFLVRIRSEMAPYKAAHELNIPLATLKKWLNDKDFGQQYQAARQYFLEKLQLEMLSIARKRRNPVGIGWVLNAHSLPYGPLKKGLVLSMLEPYLKKLRLFLAQELGQEHREKIQKALERFQLELKKRLAKVA